MVFELSPIGLKQFRVDGNLSYILFERQSRVAVLVDPDPSAREDYRAFLSQNRLHLSWIFLTEPLSSKKNDFAGQLASESGASLRKTEASFSVGGLEFQVLPTPGVAPDACCLYLKNRLIFTGRTLLIGLSSFSQADKIAHLGDHQKSVRDVIGSLPESTLILAGYDQFQILFSSLGIEKHRNANWGAQSKELAEERVTSLSLEKFLHKLESPAPGSVFIDVREPEEYSAGHIPKVFNIPMSEIALHFHELFRAKKVYLSCQSGRRSQVAAKTLAYLGLPDVILLSGGFTAWVHAGLPVVRSVD